MPTKRKEEEPEEQPRTDASGRELFDWEVDPGDQATRPTSDAEKDVSESAGSAAQEDTGESAE